MKYLKTSIEFAEEYGVDHKELLRIIARLERRGNSEEVGYRPSDFFRDGTFIDEDNKTIKIYFITPKGLLRLRLEMLSISIRKLLDN